MLMLTCYRYRHIMEAMATKSRKRRRHLKATRNCDSDDIISSLPNEVICHILSFLPTKFAVGTSILSKRWRLLWASVPIIDFEDDILLFPNNGYGDCFVNFVNSVLAMHETSCIQKFFLTCHNDHDLSCIKSWINTAAMHKVKEISLQVYTGHLIELPQSLFTCGTLEILKLLGDITLDVPASASLPNLKTLHLFGIRYMHEDTAEKLFLDCPLLETLFISKCIWDDVTVYTVRSLALKYLMIGFDSIQPANTVEQDVIEASKFKLVVDAPNLEVFYLLAKTSGDYCVKNLSSLSDAVLDVKQAHERFLDSGYHENCIFGLLRGISNAKVMFLYDDTLQYLNRVDNFEMPTFHNLKVLLFGIDQEHGWKLLPAFLKYSPNLEAVIFKKGLMQFDNQKGFEWCPPRHVPHCLLFHLRVIKIWNFRGQKDELKLVRYFLKNAKVLRMIEIHLQECDLDDDLKMKIREKISKFRRGSNSCQLEFS